MVSLVFAFSGCNLIFNDGSEDEVVGIYGVTQMDYRQRVGTLKDGTNYTFTYGDKYEYFVVVLRADKTATEYIKPVGGEEIIYDFTYSLIFDTSDVDVVESVVFENFVKPVYTYVSETVCNISFEKVDALTLEFRPKTEVLNLKGSVIGTREFLKFEKIYSSTSDARIEKAKIKQLNKMSDRGNSSTDEE